MGIGEDGKAIRRQLEGGVERAGERLQRLLRQAIDEIDIDTGDARGPDPGDRGGGIFDGLQAVDCRLYVQVEILHAETDTIDPDLPHRRHDRVVAEARIHLH